MIVPSPGGGVLDRLQHHCITIRIDGPSLRNPEPMASSANSPRRVAKANPPIIRRVTILAVLDPGDCFVLPNVESRR
jgi:hypothetical protein